MAGVLAHCLSTADAALCLTCCEMELGEYLCHIVARTNRGWPEGKYYRWLVDQAVIVDRRQRAMVRKLAGL